MFNNLQIEKLSLTGSTAAYITIYNINKNATCIHILKLINYFEITCSPADTTSHTKKQ